MSDSEALKGVSEGGAAAQHSEPPPLEILAAPSLSSELNTARFRPIPIACWRVDDIRFAFDSSFVTPDITVELKMLARLREEHATANKLYPPLALFGHADPVGSDDYNKDLSGRRATAVYALLVSGAEPDLASKLWRKVAQTENWGSSHRKVMSDLTGLSSNAPDAQLFAAYMQKLCPSELQLSRKDFLGQGADSDGRGDYQGCSEFNPVLILAQDEETRFEQAKDKDARNAANAPNWRVMVLLFRPGALINPAKWPCPSVSEGVSKCHKRFWSDGEDRRSQHLPTTRREYFDTKDTFACRFYDRLSNGSPCHRLLEIVRLTIRLIDFNEQPMPQTQYSLDVGGVKFQGITDGDGVLSHPIPKGSNQGRLDLDGFSFDLTIDDLGAPQVVIGAQHRLDNMGFYDGPDLDGEMNEPTMLALARFQHATGTRVTSELEDATGGKLHETYGS